MIYLYLHTIQDEVYNLQRGQAQPHVYGDDLAKIKIPLPPKYIQDKIVSEIEILEENEKKAVEKVQRLNVEKNNTVDTFFTNTKKLSKVSSFAEVKGGKRVPKGSSFSMTKTKHPYIRVSDFKNNSIEIKNMEYVDDVVFEKIKNYTISSDDIYISIAGTVGLIGKVPEELNNKLLTENAAKIIFLNKNEIIKDFVCYMLNSNDVKGQIKSRTKAVGVPKLAIKRIETIEIPLPSLPEQKKIVSKIEKIEKQIAGLETEIAAIPAQKEAVLKKYL